MIDYYIGNYNLDDVYDNLIIKNYSFGMKKKIQLISQFILNKNFIIIDEPTNGLDIETIAKLKKEIKIYNSNNDKVILIASHNVGFIESVCSQAIILNKGRIGNYISINDDTKLEEIYLYTVRNNE